MHPDGIRGPLTLPQFPGYKSSSASSNRYDRGNVAITSKLRDTVLNGDVLRVVGRFPDQQKRAAKRRLKHLGFFLPAISGCEPEQPCHFRQSSAIPACQSYASNPGLGFRVLDLCHSHYLDDLCRGSLAFSQSRSYLGRDGRLPADVSGTLSQAHGVAIFSKCPRLRRIPEQGTADWISKFLSEYHGFDPHTTGAAAVSCFWGLLTAGCFIGMLLLKIFDSRKVLITFCAAALFCLTAALFGSAHTSLVAFTAMGLCASVMWPILVSLALNSVAENHGAFAGILSTGIMGGAVVPLMIGRIGDHFGLRTGIGILYLTFGCVFTVGFWAKPIITNATVDLKRSSIAEMIP